ncbi:MAG: hypothetical protein ACFFA8_14215, partial [Promethearchaeota archaeon]
KHTPVVPSSSREYSARTIIEPVSQKYLSKGPRELKKYLKRQEKQRRYTIRSYSGRKAGAIRNKGTKILVGLIIIFSIMGLIFEGFGVPQYIFLSLSGLIINFTFHTIITSLFIAQTSIFWIFFLLIMIYFLYIIARNIELTYGTSFLIKLYLICTLLSALFYILLRLALIPFNYPLTFRYDYVGLAWGGILGLISYSIFPAMNREITALMYFFPIRLKGKTFLYIIILIRLIPGLLFALFALFYLWMYLPDLGGILGAYIVFKYQKASR